MIFLELDIISIFEILGHFFLGGYPKRRNNYIVQNEQSIIYNITRSITRLLVTAWVSQWVLTDGVVPLSLVEIFFFSFSFLSLHFVFINPNAEFRSDCISDISYLFWKGFKRDGAGSF